MYKETLKCILHLDPKTDRTTPEKDPIEIMQSMLKDVTDTFKQEKDYELGKFTIEK